MDNRPPAKKRSFPPETEVLPGADPDAKSKLKVGNQSSSAHISDEKRKLPKGGTNHEAHMEDMGKI